MPSRFSWRGLTPQLFALVILPLTLLLLLITFGGLRLHQLSMRNLVGERDVRSARAAANALSEQLKHRKSAIQSLALRSPSDSSRESLANILEESSHLLPDFDKGLAFYSRQFDLLEYVGDSSFWQSFDIKSAQFQKKIAGTNDAVKFLTVSSPSGIPVMLVVSAPKSDNLIAAGAFSPDLLIATALTDVFNPSSAGFAFVIDQDKRLLYQLGERTNPEEDLPSHPGVAEALNGASGSTYVQIEGGEHVVAYSPIETVGWALVIDEPWDIVASPLLRLTEFAPLVLIPVLLLALVALWFGTNRIVQPLRSLEEKASALGWGDFDAIEAPVGGVAEIRRLQAELIHLSQKVKAAQQGLRGYIGVMTRGLEEERRRLARELHDDTLQSLIALNQRVQLAHLSTNGAPEIRQTLEEIQTITESTIQDLRRLTRALRPIYLEDLGLVAAVEMLVRETQQSHGLEVRFQCAGVEKRLTEEEELALYRMVQEALSNVVRHADARQASVNITFSPTLFMIEVADDGKGFAVPDSPSAFAPEGHYGLLGLFERAELIGAKLEIHSEQGKGTRIIVTLADKRKG